MPRTLNTSSNNRRYGAKIKGEQARSDHQYYACQDHLKRLFSSSEGIISKFVSDLIKCLIQDFLYLLVGAPAANRGTIAILSFSTGSSSFSV
jgi:hypothetical protein